jgi:hypothetical protein
MLVEQHVAHWSNRNSKGAQPPTLIIIIIIIII